MQNSYSGEQRRQFAPGSRLWRPLSHFFGQNISVFRAKYGNLACNMVGKSHESNEHILVWGGGGVMEGLPKKVAPGTRKALGGPDPNVITETLIYA